MKSKWAVLVFTLMAFLLGAAATAVIAVNPLGWTWADRLTAGLHGGKRQANPTGSAAGTAATGKKERKIKYWRAPMDPNYISDRPGKSPMGMDLIPVYEDEATADSGVRVDPAFVQNFGVRTVKVEKGSIPADIRTIGILDYNQKNIASINTKYEGWIEKVQVNYIGEPVHKGDILFEIYSPQLVTTQMEYLSNLQYVKKLAAGGEADAVQRARSLLEATRERLGFWDITADQISALERNGKATRTLKVYSPVSGIVISKMSDSLEGAKVMPGMNIYKIADLSTVWAQIQVYEDQVKHLALGQTAQLTLDAFPGRHWSGKIVYIDPTVDPQTRTLKASVEIANPDLKLRPEMYASVQIHVPSVSGVVKVPEEAVLHTGERNIVIVRKASGLFEPRDVVLGSSGGGFQEVLSGLAAGEDVVTSAQFLIDSESNLKEAITKMLSAKKSGETETTQPPPAQER
jgi:RND family efflux transporter MFP subunit